MQLTDYENRCCEKLGQAILDGKISENGMLKILSTLESFINPKTVSAYTADNGGSYNTNSKKKNVPFGGVMFISDND